MPFFSSFTGSFTVGGRASAFEEAAGGGVVSNSLDFSTTTLEVTINNPNDEGTSGSDRFGYSVALSDRHAFVGAYNETQFYTGSGKCYVFDGESGGLIYTFDNPNADGYSAGDNFGWSVDINHDYAIAGAPYDGGSPSTTTSRSGRAYIFDLSTGTVVYNLANPNPYGTINNDLFGWAVGISKTNYAIVSAYAEDEAGGNSSGKAYVYDLSDGSLLYTLDNPNAYSTVAGDAFGYSAAISDTHAIVGARYEDDANGSNAGKAYIFDMSDGSLLYTLDNPFDDGSNANDYFGQYVAITTTHALVAAPGKSIDGNNNSGKAYVYDLSDGSLLYTLDNPNAYGTTENDFYAYNGIALNDSYAVVGAAFEDQAGNTDSGKVYVFDLSDGSLVNTIDNPNTYSTAQGDYFGYAVAINDTHILAGAYAEDDAGGLDSGKAYLFKGTE